MKHIVYEKEVEGERTDPPHARCLKHLLTPWATGTRNLWVGMSIVDPGNSSNPHSHKNEEIFYVVSGNGEVRVGNDRSDVKPGACIFIPAEVVHQLVNKCNKPMKVLAVVSPPFLREQFTTVHELKKDMNESCH